MKIFDFHTHCGIAHNTCYPPKAVAEFFEKIEGQAVISSLSSIFSASCARKELVELSQHKQFFLTSWVNPYDPEWQTHLKQDISSLKIVGIKLHPTANIYEPTTELLLPVFEYCNREKLFITIHTDAHRSSPRKLIDLISAFPKVPVVLIHLDDAISNIMLAKLFKNVFLETSYAEKTWGLSSLKIACECVPVNKILFGTDFPIGFVEPGGKGFNVAKYKEIAGLYAHVLGNRTAQAILSDNARRFLSV